MSYILEALRKADAERERGSVPDLHAQLLPLGAPDTPVEPARATLLPWLVVGALLAVMAGGVWYFLMREPTVVAAAAPPAAPAASDSPASAASAAAPASAAPPASAAVAVAAAASEPAAQPKPKPAPPPAARRAAPPPADAAPRARPPRQAAAAAPKPAAPDTQAARVPALGELPGELRQHVPQLVIGGSVYSPQASARMVIVNGQVFHEGSSLAPDLKVEQIRQKAAVFSIRGQLFEVPF